jgi:hypothetical protein
MVSGTVSLSVASPTISFCDLLRESFFLLGSEVINIDTL